MHWRGTTAGTALDWWLAAYPSLSCWRQDLLALSNGYTDRPKTSPESTWLLGCRLGDVLEQSVHTVVDEVGHVDDHDSGGIRALPRASSISVQDVTTPRIVDDKSPLLVAKDRDLALGGAVKGPPHDPSGAWLSNPRQHFSPNPGSR